MTRRSRSPSPSREDLDLTKAIAASVTGMARAIGEGCDPAARAMGEAARMLEEGANVGNVGSCWMSTSNMDNAPILAPVLGKKLSV